MSECFDLVGIGFGPANLALAIAFEELEPQANIRFIESRVGPTWQGGLLLDGTDIQNHPSRDLVTLRNPRSRYTFLNYLFEEGRLIEHLNLPAHFPLRKEYARYIAWATRLFADRVTFGARVTTLDLTERDGAASYLVGTADGRTFWARALCIATGRTPFLPAPFDRSRSTRVCHASEYLDRVKNLPSVPSRVAVIGSSQSAVEVTLDLAGRFPNAEIIMVLRAPALPLKDTSPFSEQGYFPAFTDYYYRASRASKRALDDYMRRTNYSCADRDVLERLYMLIYEQTLDGMQRVFLKPNRRARSLNDSAEVLSLELEELHTGAVEVLPADFIVAATGYRDLGPEQHQEPYPPLLGKIIQHYTFDESGYLVVNPDYSLEPKVAGMPPIFLNGLCESTHGIGDSGSFSLLSLRAAAILDGLRTKAPLALEH